MKEPISVNSHSLLAPPNLNLPCRLKDPFSSFLWKIPSEVLVSSSEMPWKSPGSSTPVPPVMSYPLPILAASTPRLTSLDDPVVFRPPPIQDGVVPGEPTKVLCVYTIDMKLYKGSCTISNCDLYASIIPGIDDAWSRATYPNVEMVIGPNCKI